MAARDWRIAACRDNCCKMPIALTARFWAYSPVENNYSERVSVSRGQIIWITMVVTRVSRKLAI